MANLVNAEHVTKTYGTRVVLDDVTVGLNTSEVIGVVGRNGDGKSTLLGILTGSIEPDSGRVTQNRGVSIGTLSQVDDYPPDATVRQVIVKGRADHAWAADAYTRAVVTHLLDGIDLETPVGRLSGGERRRTALVALLLGGHDLLVLDEPTNHLDVEAVAWLAEHLNELQRSGTAMLVVSHDRWFLDAVCNRVWEVHDAMVEPYDGGYAAYVLARAERARMAAASESKRKNLLRKELAWLRRGAPARTSKPKFRIDAANQLIEGEPEPRDPLALQAFATARLGKDVFDLHQVGYTLPDGRTLLRGLDWSIGPGQRIGLIGVNGAGKTTLLRLLAGTLSPTSGRVKQGKTLRLGHLTQSVVELEDSERVLESVNRLRQETKLATGREVSATNLLEDFGFRGNSLMTRIGELSGGERRRLQFLRLLLGEPNVLLLDEPTNDLDIDTLTVVEDYLDTWPGTLIVVSHDRYFLERTCDVVYALLGDGRCVLLPGGVEQYLAGRRAQETSGPAGSRQQSGSRPGAGSRSGGEPKPGAESKDAGTGTVVGSGKVAGGGKAADPAATRQAKKDLARLEQQLARTTERIAKVHGEMAAAASDYEALGRLDAELAALTAEHDRLETAWLEAAEVLG